jgi:hypothetical protein
MVSFFQNAFRLRDTAGRSYSTERLIVSLLVNGRDKVICVNKMEANEIANKVRHLRITDDLFTISADTM